MDFLLGRQPITGLGSWGSWVAGYGSGESSDSPSDWDLIKAV